MVVALPRYVGFGLAENEPMLSGVQASGLAAPPSRVWEAETGAIACPIDGPSSESPLATIARTANVAKSMVRRDRRTAPPVVPEVDMRRRFWTSVK